MPDDPLAPALPHLLRAVSDQVDGESPVPARRRLKEVIS